MPTKEELARKQAKTQTRDSKGHFIKKDQIKADFKVTGSDFKLNPQFEKPLVAVQINNPLRKIMYWLDQIRRHQTTTLAFKLSIPLIVIPVITAAAFSVGRISGLNFTNQNIVSIPPVALKSPSPQPSITISRAGILKIAKSTTTTSYLLSLKNGDILVLEVPTTIDLSKYANKQILVTGLYNKITNTLKVADIAEISIFNSTIIQATSSAN